MSSVKHVVHCNLELKRVGPIDIRWNRLDTCACAQSERAETGTVGSSVFRVTLMSFGIYIVGYIIFIVGVAIGAHLLNAPPQWIGVGVLCLIGVAIVHGVTATRQKDTPS